MNVRLSDSAAVQFLLKTYRWATYRGLTRFVSDRTHISLLYRSFLGVFPDFENPITFNEKIQYLKLKQRDPLFTRLADKIAAKEWIGNKIGEQYVVPTLAIWDSPSKVSLDGLPDRFVLKTNHDCGGVVICKNKNSFELTKAKRFLQQHFKKNYFYSSREWPYKNINPMIFAEAYLSDGSRDDCQLADYKVFCFNNGRMVTLVCRGRGSDSGLEKTFFDEHWEMLPLNEGGHSRSTRIEKPAFFEQMKDIACTLSEGFSFIRVDFFCTKEKLYVGELTFYPNSGFEQFEPRSYDELFGSWIRL